MARHITYECSHCHRVIKENKFIVPGVSGWCLTKQGWVNSLSPKDSGMYICNKCLVTLISDKKKITKNKRSKTKPDACPPQGPITMTKSNK